MFKRKMNLLFRHIDHYHHSLKDWRSKGRTQLHINISLVEALEQMSNYITFLKDILTTTTTTKKKQQKKTRSFGDFETIVLTENCSATLTNKVPSNLQDPGSFTISCIIDEFNVARALYDLEASNNLMLLSVFKRLGIEEVCPTTIVLIFFFF